MSRVITPEIEKYLELESVLVQTETKDFPATLAVIDISTLWLLLPDSFSAQANAYTLKLRVAQKYTLLPLTFEKTIRKDAYNLILCGYDPALLPETTHKKLSALLSQTNAVQKRKNERIELTHEVEIKTGLLQTASLILEDERTDCLIKDISLGGCQCICFGKMPTIAAGISSVGLQTTFTNPAADYILPAKVVRKTILESQGTFLSTFALQFFEPTNMYFEQRILSYFGQHNLAPSEAN